MSSGAYPDFGGGSGGDLTAVTSTDSSVTVTSGTGPVPDLSVAGGAPLKSWSGTTTGVATADVAVDGGDGLYLLTWQGVVASGAAPNINLRFNGAAIAGADGTGVANAIGGADTDFSASDGRIMSGAGGGGVAAATIGFSAILDFRNGALCQYISQGYSNDGTTKIQTNCRATWTPGAAMTSIGLASLTVNFTSGTTRIKRFGS